MSDSATKMVRGASLLVFDTSFSSLVGIAAFALVSRLITQTEMGIMTVLLMVTSTSQLASTLGLPNASTKFIAESMGRGDVKTASAIAVQVLKVNIATASIMALLCFSLSEIFSVHLLGNTQYRFLFQVLALNVLFSSLLPGLTGILLGLKRLRELALFGVVSFSLQQTVVVVLLVLRFGLPGIIAGWTVANLFNCAVFLRTVARSVPLSTSERFDLRVLLRYAWPLYPIAFVSLIDNWFDRVLLLGYPLSSLGAYNVAFKAFGYLYAIPMAISDGLFPHLSELKSREGVERLSKTLTLTSRYLSIIATPLALGLAATATPIISLFAGRAYVSAGQPLAILCVAAAISVLGVVLGKVLLVLDETLLYTSIILGTVVTGLGMGKLLVPLMGPVGASVARAAAMVLGIICLVVATAKRIRLRIDKQALWKSWVSALIMVTVLTLAQLLSKNWLLMPVYIVLGALTYMLMLRVLDTVTERDIELLKRLLGMRVGTPIAGFLKTILIQ